MSALWLLIDLLGAVGLLVFATRMVRTGVMRLLGERLRGLMGRTLAHPLKAAAAGVGVATLVQSSSATALLLAGFAERGLVSLAPALALMLGADIGSTLIVQAMSLPVAMLAPLLLIVGVPLFSASSATARQVARILVGLALLMVALTMIGRASAPLRGGEIMPLLLARLEGDVWLAAALGTALAFGMQSSVAFILLVLSLAAAGLVGPLATLALVAGANAGSALVPLALSWRGGVAVRRIMIGNLAFRATGALLVLPWVPELAKMFAGAGWGAATAGAMFHTALNCAIALVFLPLTGPAARVLESWIDGNDRPVADATVLHLDEAALERPDVALGLATRELMRLADMVEVMLRDVMVAFTEPDETRRERVRAIDNRVDELQEAIKLYLTRLSRRPLSDGQSRQCLDLILFTTNLEHAGDIIDKSLLQLAAKKQRRQLAFSDAGWREISGMHRRVLNQLHLAIACFVSKDPRMARELVAEKDGLRQAEREATEAHLARLRDGTVQSLETSTLHLDILRDLKRINAHVTAVANPILEASGELRASRLASAV